jgi:hypothetical protein
MKTQLPPLFTWLGLAALADWLLARTLARAAIFMPKSLALIQIYTAMGTAGQIATSLTSLLTILVLGWIAWQAYHQQRQLTLAISYTALLVVSLLGLVIPTAGWLALSFQMVLGVALLVLLRQVWRRPLGFEFKIAVSMVALTLLVTSLYQGLNPLATILGLPGLPVSAELLFNAGELLVLISVLALWWSIARKAQASIWLIAALPALLFAVPRLLSPAMTGIMTIWSTGLTLFLPWPVYVLALWLAGVTVLHALQQGDLAGWAVILLLAGGFAPQLSIQAFLGLIALWLLVNAAGPREQPIQEEVEARSNSKSSLAILDQGV